MKKKKRLAWAPGWIAILSFRLSETAVNASKLVVLCLGIGLHIIESSWEEDRGWIGRPGYHWFYRLGYCICVSVMNAWGQGTVWKHHRHYLWMTAETTLGESETLSTDKVCVYWSGDGEMCVRTRTFFFYWVLSVVCVCLMFVLCNLGAFMWTRGEVMTPNLRLSVSSIPCQGLVSCLNISSVLVVLGSAGQARFDFHLR